MSIGSWRLHAILHVTCVVVHVGYVCIEVANAGKAWYVIMVVVAPGKAMLPVYWRTTNLEPVAAAAAARIFPLSLCGL